MDLPPDKAKFLKQYDDEKKWDIICDQVRIRNVGYSMHALVLRDWELDKTKLVEFSCKCETNENLERDENFVIIYLIEHRTLNYSSWSIIWSSL